MPANKEKKEVTGLKLTIRSGDYLRIFGDLPGSNGNSNGKGRITPQSFPGFSTTGIEEEDVTGRVIVLIIWEIEGSAEKIGDLLLEERMVKLRKEGGVKIERL